MAYEGYQHRKVFQDDPDALATSAKLQVGGADVDAANPLPIAGLVDDGWRTGQVSNAAVGSNKRFTVPAGQEWLVTSIMATLTTTAAAGNRQVVAWFRSADTPAGVLSRAWAIPVQAASLTRGYRFGINVETSFVFESPTADLASVMLPIVPLAAGWTLDVYDSAAIAAAADTLLVTVSYKWREV